MNRRGQGGLSSAAGTFFFLMIVAVFGVTAYIVLAGLGDSTSDSAAVSAIGNFTASLQNVVSYAPTWGTILGVAVLITIVFGAFTYYGRDGAL